MSAPIATFAAATPDRAVRVITRFAWATAGLLAVVGVVLAASRSMVGPVLLVVALLEGGLAWWLRRVEPVSYVVRTDGLTIERRNSDARVFEGAVRDARRGRLGLRVAGDGGLYGYLGKYRADGKTVDAFVTSRSDVVLARVGDREVALSPADPDAFVAAAGGSRG
jgi:hypothetical protein